MIKYLRQLYVVDDFVNTKIYPGLNATKGILIMLVIFTHSLPNGMILYFNYFFHMPVFLAVSGFLIKESAFKHGLLKYLQRLTHRLVIPWIIASICYLPLSLNGKPLADINLTDFIYPFFHLWYVPAYIFGAILCYAVTKFRIPPLPVLMITAAFTVLWYIYFRDNKLPVEEQALYYFGDKRVYSYLFFFFLGFSLRNGLVKFYPSPLILLFLVSMASVACVVFVYRHIPSTIIVIPYMFFNISLVLFILLYAAPQNWFQHKLILLINKQSLGIYLYHPMIIFLIYRIMGDPDKERVSNLEGLGVGLSTLIIVLVLIKLIQKWGFTNRYLLGIIKEKE